METDKLFNGINIKIEAPDLHEHLSSDIITRFDGDDLGIITNSEMMQQETFFMNNDTEDENEGDDIIVLHMDIRQPLSSLRTLLENKIGESLKNYEFWLQDAQMLEPHKNLVDQCVQGEGLVQINVQVQSVKKRINIIDVLKPTEDVVAEEPKHTSLNNYEKVSTEEQSSMDIVTMDESTVEEEEKDYSNVNKWVVDAQFKRDQARLKIPDDPTEWTSAQVKHWLQWAVRQFNLSQIKLQDWSITGKDLCNITLESFQQKVPNDPGDIFWTHLELLRKCKFAAVIQKSVDETDDSQAILRLKQLNPRAIHKPLKIMKQMCIDPCPCGNRTGNNGQIQLWQFLLEILTDKEHTAIIQWIGGNGEFKLNNPERVAQLWGERKNKPTMNYEKLSRALRYYYDGDMISKVHGKRFVYKFVCDLKQLIGYDAAELSNLLNQCSAYKTRFV